MTTVIGDTRLLTLALRALSGQSDSVVAIERNGKRYWVKRPGSDKHKPSHTLLRFVAWLSRIEMLRPTVSRGGQDAMTRELARLERLRGAKFPVPRVAAVGEDFFVTEDNGAVLMNIARTLPEEGRDWLFAQIAQAAGILASMHRQGLCHGRPSLKDIAVKDDRITFLDFEEAPEAVMTVEAACLRDVWLFLSSIGRLERKWPGLCAAAWQGYREKAPEALVRRFEEQALRLDRLSALLLKTGGRWFGRDVLGVLHTIRLVAGR